MGLALGGITHLEDGVTKGSFSCKTLRKDLNSKVSATSIVSIASSHLSVTVQILEKKIERMAFRGARKVPSMSKAWPLSLEASLLVTITSSTLVSESPGPA